MMLAGRHAGEGPLGGQVTAGGGIAFRGIVFHGTVFYSVFRTAAGADKPNFGHGVTPKGATTPEGLRRMLRDRSHVLVRVDVP